MVADEHRRAGRPGLVEPAAAVGQHDGPAAGLGRRTDPVHDRRDALALVEVRAAEEHQQLLVTRADAADLAGVAGHRGRGEAGQVGRRDLGSRLAQRVDRGQPAGAQHQRHVVPLDAGLLGEGGGGLLARSYGVRLGGVSIVMRQTLMAGWSNTGSILETGRIASRAGYRYGEQHAARGRAGRPPPTRRHVQPHTRTCAGRNGSRPRGSRLLGRAAADGGGCDRGLALRPRRG